VPLAFALAALLGAALERTLYVHVYRKPHLDQVLFTIGLVFMAVATVDYLIGSGQVFVRLPTWLEGQVSFAGIGFGRYRLLIIVLCGGAAFAPSLALRRTRCGQRPRRAGVAAPGAR